MNHSVYGVWFGDGIVVEQKDIIGTPVQRMSDSNIVALCEPKIPPILYDFDSGIIVFD